MGLKLHTYVHIVCVLSMLTDIEAGVCRYSPEKPLGHPFPPLHRQARPHSLSSTPVSGHECAHPVHRGHTCARACPHIRLLVHFSTPLTGALSQRTPAHAPAYKCGLQTFPARGGAGRGFCDRASLGTQLPLLQHPCLCVAGRGAGAGASEGVELARGPLEASGHAGWEPRSPTPALRIFVAQPRTEMLSLHADCLVWPLSPSCS